MADELIVLEGVYEEEEAGVVQLAGGKVEAPDLGGAGTALTSDDHREDLEDLVTEDQYTDFYQKHLGGGNFGQRYESSLNTTSEFTFQF